MSAPRSLRARIAIAAVCSLAVAYALAGFLLISGVERDGRAAVDRDLRQRADLILRRALPAPAGGVATGVPGRPPGERLLAGSGTFVQVSLHGQVVEQRGDVPLGAPVVPSKDGMSTVQISGTPWRALTITVDPVSGAQLGLFSSLEQVEARVANTRHLVVWLGLAALAVTALAAWGFTSLALRPLARLRAGAARVSGAEDLGTALPDDDGPDEVRSLARTLNEMLARLRASTATMERALHATRRFAADAGHELRTPLTGMRANLDALARNPDLPPDERQALLRDVTAEQERIVHLLEGLQALARGDAAESLPREEVEVGDLVDAAVYAARRRHPEVTYELHDSVDGAAVSGWGGGLRLLVDNLLDNAALHGRPGGRIDVSVAGENGSLLVRVDDDGPGIPAEARDRVLEPFARGLDATAPGTGLGLAIVAQQVALHGGEMRLDDSPLGGLRVRVALPANRKLGPPPAAPPAPARGS
jgi:two-component system, OmpR family, sensor histidine kinase PrrB